MAWKEGGWARWNLADVARGDYTAQLEFFSGPFAGGTIKLDAPGRIEEFEIRGSGKWEDEKVLDLGKVSVTTGGETILLTVLEARLQGVMEFAQIRLSPTAKAAGQPVAAPERKPGDPLPEEELPLAHRRRRPR